MSGITISGQFLEMRGLKLKLPGGQWPGCSFLGGALEHSVFPDSGSLLLVDDAGSSCIEESTSLETVCAHGQPFFWV